MWTTLVTLTASGVGALGGSAGLWTAWTRHREMRSTTRKYDEMTQNVLLLHDAIRKCDFSQGDIAAARLQFMLPLVEGHKVFLARRSSLGMLGIKMDRKLSKAAKRRARLRYPISALRRSRKSLSVRIQMAISDYESFRNDHGISQSHDSHKYAVESCRSCLKYLQLHRP
ncbi:hypothetical protein [Streptomyces sp. SID13588]|uniref:hypothetical protein n=1 Tax=Streptomyces sp. SID13588 TaxID=2706051 RepID=UPI0013C820A8|nr:hypothetical protein [Streptomyces sp. SID13588]NEA74789.1 hypothetical protein [Streptomyces sp. SID13588]